MQKQFECKFKVRGYELDGYGHVNHAVYLNYFEYARWCMIEESGCGSDYFSALGFSPVIARAEVDYRSSCLLAEELTVRTHLESLRSRVAVFSQQLFRPDGKLACEGKMTLVVVDKAGRAVSLPDNFTQFFGQPRK